MQDYPLTVDAIFWRTEAHYTDRALIDTGPVEGATTYGAGAQRTRRLGGARNWNPPWRSPAAPRRRAAVAPS